LGPNRYGQGIRRAV
jgi:hypothetical protein